MQICAAPDLHRGAWRSVGGRGVRGSLRAFPADLSPLMWRPPGPPAAPHAFTAFPESPRGTRVSALPRPLSVVLGFPGARRAGRPSAPAPGDLRASPSRVSASGRGAGAAICSSVPGPLPVPGQQRCWGSRAAPGKGGLHGGRGASPAGEWASSSRTAEPTVGAADGLPFSSVPTSR